MADQTPTAPQSSNGTEMFVKGAVAGLFVGSLNRYLLLGAAIGTAAGAYYHQQFGAPDVKKTLQGWATELKSKGAGK
jgi:hypothetical protein